MQNLESVSTAGALGLEYCEEGRVGKKFVYTSCDLAAWHIRRSRLLDGWDGSEALEFVIAFDGG